MKKAEPASYVIFISGLVILAILAWVTLPLLPHNLQGAPMVVYIASWSTACLIAIGLFLKDYRSYALSQADYWHFLFKRWKVITLLVAATGMTLIAPYTGDPTWDYVDALFMSVLAFTTAPWVLGVIYKTIRRECPVVQVYVAVCVWMFSASWSYDLYLLIRDGSYPVTWQANIFASSLLYISAGLFWNLDWKPGRGVIFAFMDEGWPEPSSVSVFKKVYGYALILMIIVSACDKVFLIRRSGESQYQYPTAPTATIATIPTSIRPLIFMRNPPDLKISGYFVPDNQYLLSKRFLVLSEHINNGYPKRLQ